MKPEDIPTPITDELLKRNAQSCNLPQDDYESLAKLSENLERKLAVCRDALKPFAAFEAVRFAMGGTTPKQGPYLAVCGKAGEAEITVEDMQATIKTLTLTAPNQ